MLTEFLLLIYPSLTLIRGRLGSRVIEIGTSAMTAVMGPICYLVLSCQRSL